jgi:hypothetical protein
MEPSTLANNRTTDFLTRERHLGRLTKIALLSLLVLAVLGGSFFPAIISLFEWCRHPTSTYQGHVVRLPLLWTVDRESQEMAWVREPHSVFTPYGDDLGIWPTPRRGTDEQNLEIWHQFYGFSGPNDLKRYPELQGFLDRGMMCGSIKYGELEAKVQWPDCVRLSHEGSQHHIRL